MPQVQTIATLFVFVTFAAGIVRGDDAASQPWRTLPLIQDGKVHPDWTHLGYGSFVVEGDALRTECDAKGMGLLLYQAEPFGQCQIRVVFKAKDAKSNAGVFVRIDPAIRIKLNEKTAPVRRDKDGNVEKDSMAELMKASEDELGVWYPVHHGYEVQICDDADPIHRTGAIYSLAKATNAPHRAANEWRTMIISLNGNVIDVEVDGQTVTHFDPGAKDIPSERQWYEPKREPKRPTSGYLGLQNHDPGDVVYFKEISVRPLVPKK